VKRSTECHGLPAVSHGAVDVATAWARAAARHGERPALVTQELTVSYRELDAWSVHVARAMREHGVGTGSRVALVVANSAHAVAVVVALSRLGAVLVPLDPTLTATELDDLVDRSGAGWVVSDGTAGAALPAGSGRWKGLALDDLVPTPPADVPLPVLEPTSLGPDDLWAIMFTSGSTSRPRGVMIPQRSFDETGRAMADALGYRGDDTVGSVLPFHHASVTLMSWAPAVAVGAAFALSGKFSRSGFWDFVRTSGTTVMTTVPTIAEILLTADPGPSDRDHPLRCVVTHRGVPAFSARFGVEVRALWAMTETGGLGCVQRPGDPAGSVGPPYPPDAEVRLVRADGTDAQGDEVGELWFRHPATMSGYLGEAPPPDGWIASGDLATRDAGGVVSYVGRQKNMIKRGGENVSLEELERTIFEHPDVAEVAVVAVPDPIFVEEACAVVVWRDGLPHVEALRRYCDERLASWKSPRYIVSRTRPLPKLTNLKLDRRALVAETDLDEADDRQPGRARRGREREDA
jgi:acyl-CoA synthetase (AMP-forming)/AMP-acid ligase II